MHSIYRMEGVYMTRLTPFSSQLLHCCPPSGTVAVKDTAFFCRPAPSKMEAKSVNTALGHLLRWQMLDDPGISQNGTRSQFCIEKYTYTKRTGCSSL